MSLITTSRPDASGAVTLIVTGKEKPSTQKIIAKYLERTRLKVASKVNDPRPQALRCDLFIHGIAL